MSDAHVRQVKGAYEGSADAWAKGPSLVYQCLAEALLDTSPVPCRTARPRPCCWHERFGYQRPPWYDDFKQRVAVLTGDSDRLATMVSAAGLLLPFGRERAGHASTTVSRRPTRRPP
jgi:hypothetical protein